VLKATSETILLNLEVVVGLKVQPELRRVTKILCQAERGVSRQGPLPEHDLVDTTARNTDVFGQTVLAEPKRLQELLKENFARMDRRNLGAHGVLVGQAGSGANQ
jgi:hypothetical protein